ncbi:MAG: hypothetical protein J1E38_07395 [Paramuribaculum sp.]|nr:hypothetical protein [Paramuribaculum sp.]
MKKLFLTFAVAFVACMAVSCTSSEKQAAAEADEVIEQQEDSVPQQADEAQTNVDDTEALSSN